MLTALLLCCALTGYSQDIEANGIYYNIISETQVAVAPAWHDGVNRYEGCIILPERVYCDGVNYDVAAIAPRAFWQSAVTRVQIPNSVTMIGEAAFADAVELTDITLPLGLKAISRYMLAGTAVTNVVLPEGLTDIGAGAFEDCDQLHTVFLPYTLQTIGERAFAYCSNLAELYSDAAVPPLTLGDDAFEGCDGIDVMLADDRTTQRYQDDGVWGDEGQFTLWVDEGLAVLPMMHTTLMRDEEDLQLVATAQPAAIEDVKEDDEPRFNIVGLDGTIYIQGDTHGYWTFIYDVYGNLWYERPAVNNWISLPGHRVYIVKVGKTVRKVFLN